MCGIGGKISFDGRPDPDVIDRMNDSMVHRGPNAQDGYADANAVLAHCRLSILDLSDAGRQPMSNADGTVQIVFNGGIYNYRELRSDLDHYRFTSETDTEVLLHLYEEHGVNCLQHLRGMFAFAIWDAAEERLFLARDRLGQKPLFYRHDDDAFWFGSTVKTILADDEVTAAPDYDALGSYLRYQYVPNPRTGFEGIRQLEPAEYAVVTEDGVRRETYWSLSFADKLSGSASHVADRLAEELREATRLRMRSDVPLGVFLSGGIDSSVVTALMSDLSSSPVHTYSIGFGEESYDELNFAREVADVYGTDHHEYTVEPDSMEVFPALVDHYEMPFGDPSALPTYYVSQIAADDITVALTGDAGDENFAGYDRYTRYKLLTTLKRVPRPLRRAAVAGYDALPTPLREWTPLQYLGRGTEISLEDVADLYAFFICHASADEVRDVFDADGTVDADELRRAFAAADGPTYLDDVMATDIRTYLPDDLLVKVDRASMAHSLEVRSPFLDHEFVEFAARIPAKYKWRRGTQKWILKRAFEEALPEMVVERSKQGFGVPVTEWFRGELRPVAADALDALGARPRFDRRGLRAVLDDHVAEREDNGYRLWDLLFLERWFEQYVDE
ncbi:MAG: asparagine synthase (glutamine-hydrolyzing) [Haloplanus sp.]